MRTPLQYYRQQWLAIWNTLSE